jgi:hypothetical protein
MQVGIATDRGGFGLKQELVKQLLAVGHDDELLQELGQYIDEPEQFTFQAEVEVDEVSPRGQKIQYTSNIEIAVRRPNRLFVSQEGDLQNRSLWFDGDRFILLDRDLNHYLSVDTPNTLDEAIPFLEDRGVTAPLADFLTGDFYQGAIANVKTGLYSCFSPFWYRRHFVTRRVYYYTSRRPNLLLLSRDILYSR